MARLRRSGLRVHRNTFRPHVRLNTRQVRDMRGRTMTRGRTLRSWRASAGARRHAGVIRRRGR